MQLNGVRAGLRRAGALLVGTGAIVFGSTGEALAAYESTVLSDNPASYFRLDETGDATVMVNEVPAGANGTHEGLPVQGLPGALVNESPNLAIAYTSQDSDRSRFSAGANYSAFSIEFWMFSTSVNLGADVDNWFEGSGLVDGEVTGVTSDTGVAVVRNGHVGFGMGAPDTTIESTTDVSDGAWHHVVATANGGGEMRLYVDGVLEASTTAGPTGSRTNANFSIGSLDTGFGAIDAGLDEVAFYRYKLTDADVTEHFEAVAAPDVTVLVRDYLYGGEGTVTSAAHGIDCGPITDACDTVVPFGTSINFTAVPAPGSRFGEWDEDSGCVPLDSTTCNFVADSPGFNNVMVLGSNFHFKPAVIANEMAGTSDEAAAVIDNRISSFAFPKNNNSSPDYSSFLVPQDAANFGDSAGEVAINVPANDVSNIENQSGTIDPRPPKPQWLIGSDGGSLIGSDGATLLGSDGATLLGSDGATRRGGTEKACGEKVTEKGVTYVLGRYAEPIPGDGPLGVRSVEFTFTDEGKEFLDAFAKMNLKRTKKDKKPMPLPITYVEAIQPPDEVGAGGAYDVHCVEKGTN